MLHSSYRLQYINNGSNMSSAVLRCLIIHLKATFDNKIEMIWTWPTMYDKWKLYNEESGTCFVIQCIMDHYESGQEDDLHVYPLWLRNKVTVRICSKMRANWRYEMIWRYAVLYWIIWNFTADSAEHPSLLLRITKQQNHFIVQFKKKLLNWIVILLTRQW